LDDSIGCGAFVASTAAFSANAALIIVAKAVMLATQ
jgi:hypothetical protein